MGEQGRGFSTEIKLCIISIGMEAETMVADDLTKETVKRRGPISLGICVTPEVST